MADIRVLSLGAGVQSTAVLLLSLRGGLPPLDHVVFADTRWEPREVYEHLERLHAECERAGVPLTVVTDPSAPERGDAARFGEKAPVFVSGSDGHAGMGRRSCSWNWKIKPIDRFIRREVLMLKPRQRVPAGIVVRKVFGISWDEIQRMRRPVNHWEVYEHPLIDMRWTRKRCVDWLALIGWTAPRSACVTCPFHSNHEWRRIQQDPEAWELALATDEGMRRDGVPGMRLPAYLHRSLKPLAEVDLSTSEDRGQVALFGDECLGICGT